MTIDELGPYIKEHKEEIVLSLLEGRYQPQAVKGVEIPKPKGGTRQLGIPTVLDRLVQQAIHQVGVVGENRPNFRFVHYAI